MTYKRPENEHDFVGYLDDSSHKQNLKPHFKYLCEIVDAQISADEKMQVIWSIKTNSTTEFVLNTYEIGSEDYKRLIKGIYINHNNPIYEVRLSDLTNFSGYCEICFRENEAHVNIIDWEECPSSQTSIWLYKMPFLID